MSVPRASVRLQFNRDFTLDDALQVVDYYADLGISHFYASPLQRARKDSKHGYDVIDYGEINPELGGIDALRRLVTVLRAHAMGLILDIVPNHMAACEENPWWFDVLEYGQNSRYAEFFDIDWDTPDPGLRGQVLLPFLATPYDDALENITIRYEARQGRLLIEADGHQYPLAPDTYAQVLTGVQAVHGLAGAARRSITVSEVLRNIALEPPAIQRQVALFNHNARTDRAHLRQLLERQHYSLASWREAATRINWRRFCDITDLVSLRMDRTEVFDAVHQLVFRLYREGLIDGVRVDHIDGIADPRVYCARLRDGLVRAHSGTLADDDRAYIVVEKILAHNEHLRENWNADGTTGYDFMEECNGVLHDAAGVDSLNALWHESGGGLDFSDYVRAARREAVTTAFVADVDRMVRDWKAMRESKNDRVPLTASDMCAAVILLLQEFDIYRTYLETTQKDKRDTEYLRHMALKAQARATPKQSLAVDDLVTQLLIAAGNCQAEASSGRLLRRFQQLLSPVAAKAVEDTAFYRYGRLFSRNEVGADPGCLALSPDDFHTACRLRLMHAPDAMLATATHDHKRGEDVRARLAVLSQLGARWTQAVRRWRVMNADLRAIVDGALAPSASDELILLQMLVGAWPLSVRAGNVLEIDAFIGRIVAWQIKALREAKRATSWINPNPAYESACESYLRAALGADRPFLTDLVRFVDSIAAASAVNSLAQVMLRLTTPGVPDLYQGCEYWDLSLVDPDNRRPVDYAVRRASLTLQDSIVLVDDWRTGHVKQAVIARLLRFRAEHAGLFYRGSYRPLNCEGPLQRQAIAFSREDAIDSVIIIATRLCALYLSDDVPRIPPSVWDRTVLCSGGQDAGYREVLTDREIRCADGILQLREVLQDFPIALLVRC